MKRAGLVIVCTICDMGQSNVNALQLLEADFWQPFLLHEERKIFTVFNPPQLLKCSRYLLLKYNVQLLSRIRGETTILTGKWEHLQILADGGAVTKGISL
jgi:hypothetical protein